MIRFHDVSVRYPNGILALSHVDLPIARGEFVFIVGPSGSGKSTLLRLIYREQLPEGGTVVVGGKNVAQLPPSQVPALRRSLGIVFQDYRLLPQRTVFENVGFALDVVGTSRREKNRKINIALELVGLRQRASHMPDELSGGEQQRVCMARSLVNSPPILLADEPTGNLDPDTSWEIVQLLNTINATGTTVVMATHDKSIVDAMQRRVVSLINGVVVRDDLTGAYDDGP